LFERRRDNVNRQRQTSVGCVRTGYAHHHGVVGSRYLFASCRCDLCHRCDPAASASIGRLAGHTRPDSYTRLGELGYVRGYGRAGFYWYYGPSRLRATGPQVATRSLSNYSTIHGADLDALAQGRLARGGHLRHCRERVRLLSSKRLVCTSSERSCVQPDHRRLVLPRDKPLRRADMRNFSGHFKASRRA
jgi:hypothetical protein